MIKSNYLLKPKFYDKSTSGPDDTITQVFDDLDYCPTWFFSDNNIETIVDIGAMIGSFSLWAHEKWPNAMIYSYEPDPKSFNFLKQNIEFCSNPEKIKFFNSAIWNAESEVIFQQFEKTPSCNSMFIFDPPYVSGSSSKIKIKTDSISNVLKKLDKIDFLKIDCEGSEYDIMYSLSKNELKKIKYIALEYHEFDNNNRHTANEISNFLRNNGFLTQIVPKAIGDFGFGYIYAAQIKNDSNLINKIFDGEKSRILRNILLPITLQEKLIKLQNEFDERTEWALNLDKESTEKSNSILNLQNSLSNNETKLQETQETLSSKETKLQETQETLSSKETKLQETQETLSSKETKLQETQETLSSKETKLQETQETLSSKETKLQETQETLSSKETKLQETQETLSSKETKLQETQETLSSKETKLQETQETLSSKETKLQETQETLSSKETKLQETQETLSSKETKLQETQEILITKESQIEELQGKFYIKQNELDSLKSSILFKFPFKIARGLDKTFPEGSKRGEFLRLLRMSLLIIQNDGIGALFQALNEKIKRRRFLKKIYDIKLKILKYLDQQN